jgi:hypothetical protein
MVTIIFLTVAVQRNGGVAGITVTVHKINIGDTLNVLGSRVAQAV